jgi:hypothetical protein
LGEPGNLPGWQRCRGISGSFRVEWVAGFVWNQWQPWSGIRKGLNRLKHIKAILQSNRDKLPEQLSLHADLPQHHENIRGPKSFH